MAEESPDAHAPARAAKRDHRWAAAAFAAMAALLVVTAIDGTFTVDDSNYLVTAIGLRKGTVTLPGTAGLPPSPELLFFDPAAWTRVVRATPVASTAPPLWAPVALPALPFGVRGLIALNAIAFAATAYLIFLLTARHARSRSGPFLASAVFVLGSFGVEYAQGIWPHMIAVFLCTLGIYLSTRALEEGRPGLAACAGLAIGWAAGVRYQNAVFAAAVLAGLAALATGRLRARLAAAFAAGAALPLSLCSVINHARLGSWNPISKGPTYLYSSGSGRTAGQLVSEAVRSLYTTVVDFSAHPPFTGDAAPLFPADRETGAFLVLGALKKALLQSCPWALLAIVVLALAWRRGRSSPKDRALRLLALPWAAVVGMFALYGFRIHDGWCFNQRYYLELLPLAAMAIAWEAEALVDRIPDVAIGGLIGAAIAAVPFSLGGSTKLLILLYAPLGLAVVLVVCFVIGRSPEATSAVRRTVGWMLGVTLAWSLIVHVADDVKASRAQRAAHERVYRAIDLRLPKQSSALLCFWGDCDPLGPLLLGRDLVIAKGAVDRAADVPRLVDAFLGAGRRTFVFADGWPPPVLGPILADRKVKLVSEAPLILEVMR